MKITEIIGVAMLIILNAIPALYILIGIIYESIKNRDWGFFIFMGWVSLTVISMILLVI